MIRNFDEGFSYEERLNDRKNNLIELIEWYRDEYHKNEFGHNELIERVNKAMSDDEIDRVWQIVDGWID